MKYLYGLTAILAILLASAGQEASDFNELVVALNTAGHALLPEQSEAIAEAAMALLKADK